MSFDQAFTQLRDLNTKRLNIRQLRQSDAEAIFQIKSNIEVTSRYCAEPDKSIEQTMKWIDDRITNYKNHSVLYWVVTLSDEDRAIGSICFWHIDLADRFAELGYELNPTYWKQGYMIEALHAVLEYGFEIGFHRIEACPLSINEASTKLLLKLGFRHEGTLRHRCLFHGQYWDQLYFGILKEEWRKNEHFEPQSYSPS